MADEAVLRVLMGYDGSTAANAAIEGGALLLPRVHARIAHLWTPPFASESLRRRLWMGTRHVDEFVAAIEREGEWEAGRLARSGVLLAAASGWQAEPLIRRAYGGEGIQLAELAAELHPDLVLVGSRGLAGARALFGSVSDMVVHYAPQPVLVIPYPLLRAEFAALSGGPVLVGWDGSTGARDALNAATRLWPDRDRLVVSVDGDEAVPPPADSPSVGAGHVKYLDVDTGQGGPGQAVADALSRCARDHGAAVVVVGSRGRSAAAEIVLGSVAMATLHHAHRPVVVVSGGRRTPGGPPAPEPSSGPPALER